MVADQDEGTGFCELERDVIDADLCTRCGGCVASCPVNALTFGPNRIELTGECTRCGTCYRICPGKGVDFSKHEKRLYGRSRRTPLGSISGSYMERVNLVSADGEILKAGYFGGRVSSVLINALERGDIDAAALTDWSSRGALSVGEARLARTRKEVLALASSKYVFSPVLALLRQVAGEPEISKIAVVGLPCHVEAMRNMEIDPTASRAMEKVKYIIGLNCGAPNTSEGERRRSISKAFDVPEEDIKGFRAEKISKNRVDMELVLNSGMRRRKVVPSSEYLRMFHKEKGWPRCGLCPDYCSDLSDVTFGHPLIRTRKGKHLVDSALERGYLKRGSLSRSLVQKGMDLYIGIKKRRSTRKGIKQRKKEGRPYPLFR
ncbi:MAG: Coenzyme F420 hydrogenase/dehydrogenase, beta subunit C-terminal domain [Thermoplasmatota archaeon]